jgi:hypothetical protein
MRREIAGNTDEALGTDAAGIPGPSPAAVEASIPMSARVVGVALVERPVFPQARAWLAGDVPHDAQAKMLCDRFAARLERDRRAKAQPPINRSAVKASATVPALPRLSPAVCHAILAAKTPSEAWRAYCDSV